MPQLEEVGGYLKGIWLLIAGNREGLGWLDISAAGVWSSFAAIVWCLPAMAVSWGAWRLHYLSAMPAGTEIGLAFVLKLFIVDLAAWILPLLLVALLAKPLGYADYLASIIVTTNWLSLPAVYISVLPVAIGLVVPGSEGLAASLSLVVLMVFIIAIFRLLHTVTGKQTLLASALSMLFILPSLMIIDALQRLFGLVAA